MTSERPEREAEHAPEKPEDMEKPRPPDADKPKDRSEAPHLPPGVMGDWATL